MVKSAEEKKKARAATQEKYRASQSKKAKAQSNKAYRDSRFTVQKREMAAYMKEWRASQDRDKKQLSQEKWRAKQGKDARAHENQRFYKKHLNKALQNKKYYDVLANASPEVKAKRKKSQAIAIKKWTTSSQTDAARARRLRQKSGFKLIKKTKPDENSEQAFKKLTTISKLRRQLLNQGYQQQDENFEKKRRAAHNLMVDTVDALLRADLCSHSDSFAEFRSEHLYGKAQQNKFFKSKFDEEMCISVDISIQISFKRTRQSEEEQGRRLLIGRALSRQVSHHTGSHHSRIVSKYRGAQESESILALEREVECLRGLVNMKYRRDIYDAMVQLLKRLLGSRAPSIADKSKNKPYIFALRKFKDEMRGELKWLWTSTYGKQQANK